MAKSNVVEALGTALFNASKHKRATDGKFAFQGGPKKAAPKTKGSVAAAHDIFNKMKGKPKAEVMAAAQAAGINKNTAKTQFYHWQKAQAAKALGDNPAPTKADLQAAAAKALGVKPAAGAPAPKPTPSSSSKPTGDYSKIVNGHGSPEEKEKKLTQRLFQDMDAAGPMGSVKHLQDGYEKALVQIKAQKPKPAPKPAPKPPEDTSHLKGYDHMLEGSAPLHDKMIAVKDKYDKDLGKAKTQAEIDKISENFNATFAKAKGMLKAGKPPAHLQGYDDVLALNMKSSDKMTAITAAYKANLEKAKNAQEFETIKGHYEAAKTKIKAEMLAASAAKAPAPVTASKEPPSLEKLGPTKYVHALADHMKGADGKAVKAAAVAAGVNKSTASVQYSKWKKNQAGEPYQLKESPEPKALQAKQPDQMTDKELDKAIGSYQGKLNVKTEAASKAPTAYNSDYDYQPHEGGKALTAKMKNGDVYTHPTQHKTFFKGMTGSVYEHTGTTAGPMTKLSGDGIEIHYDPQGKLLYGKVGGVLTPITGAKTPVFKSQQPPKAYGDHAFKEHAWAGANGVQNPDSKGVHEYVTKTWEKAGVTYNGTSSAVVSYTGDGFGPINKQLRDSNGQTVGAKAQEIDALIAKSSFKEETIMWRGVGQGGTVWNGAPPPPDVTDHGFTSVSFRPDVAKNFSDGKTIFRVRVPKGFPGLNVAIGQPSGGGKAGLEGEAEVMLPRGTTYKVVERHAAAADKQYGGGTMDVVDLEPVLPDWYIKKYGAPKLQ